MRLKMKTVLIAIRLMITTQTQHSNAMIKTVIKNTNFFTNTSSPRGVEVHVYIPDKDASEHFFD